MKIKYEKTITERKRSGNSGFYIVSQYVVPHYEYHVLVHPRELEGFESLWNVILNAKNESVVVEATNFLIRLFTKVQTLTSMYEKSDLYDFYIEKCTEYI